MIAPVSKYMTLLGREIHYLEWGFNSKPPLVLWHGLARNARDFDDLASTLVDDFHIFVPDTIGRGWSQWSSDPEREYCYPFYVRLAAGFVDALQLPRFDWVGTSMGGAIGIHSAATLLAARIRRLVLNDIGPQIDSSARERIQSYAGNPPQFKRLTELEDYFRKIYKPFGHLNDAQWRRLTETSARRLPDGNLTTHYDPNVVMQFTHQEDYDQWALWDTIRCEVLCLRGVDSDLLLPAVADEMTKRGPRCRLVNIPGCGHAPALNVREQIRLIADFLKAPA